MGEGVCARKMEHKRIKSTTSHESFSSFFWCLRLPWDIGKPHVKSQRLLSLAKRKVAHLYKVKIKLSHVEQMAADQNVNSVHVKLQLGWTITYEPRNRERHLSENKYDSGKNQRGKGLMATGALFKQLFRRLPSLFVFQLLPSVAYFQALAIGHVFSRPYHWLYVFRACHQSRVLPRLPLATCFLTVAIGRVFSRA